MLLVAVVRDPVPHPAVPAGHCLLVHQTELNDNQSKLEGPSPKAGRVFQAHKQPKLLPTPWKHINISNSRGSWTCWTWEGPWSSWLVNAPHEKHSCLLSEDFEENSSVPEVSNGCQENITFSSKNFVKNICKNICKVLYRDSYLCWFRW